MSKNVVVEYAQRAPAQTRPAAARCPRQAGAAEPATPAGGPECCHRSLEGHLGSVASQLSQKKKTRLLT